MTATVTRADVRPITAVLGSLAMMVALLVGAPVAIGQTSSEEGAGVATGTEHPAAQVQMTPNIDPMDPLPVFCAEVARDSSLANPDLLYTLDGEGTYTGDSGAVIYSTTVDQQPLEIEVTATGDSSRPTFPYYIAPEGTYTQSDCEGGGELPGANGIPVDVSIHAPDSVEDGGKEECDGEGKFSRVDGNFTLKWDLGEDCHVDGNVPQFGDEGVAAAGTSHLFEGHLSPCSPLGDPATCGDAQLVGAYQQDPLAP